MGASGGAHPSFDRSLQLGIEYLLCPITRQLLLVALDEPWLTLSALSVACGMHRHSTLRFLDAANGKPQPQARSFCSLVLGLSTGQIQICWLGLGLTLFRAALIAVPPGYKVHK